MTGQRDGKENIFEGGEINILQLFLHLWSKRKALTRVFIISAILGIIVAYTQVVEYESMCKLMPENEESSLSSLGGLGGLAGIAGIDVSNLNQEALSPDLYPEIVKSKQFLLELINEPIAFDQYEQSETPYAYFESGGGRGLWWYIAEYTIGLPGKIKRSFAEAKPIPKSQENILRLTYDEKKLLEKFSDRINLDIDAKSGIIIITGLMPDPLASASLVQETVNLLKQKITDYKIQKIRQNLDFVTDQLKESKKRFESIQKDLALFKDQNRNVTTALAETELQMIQNEYDLAFEIYKELASQKEQIEIQVNERTPVFTILEFPNVPNEKAKPKRLIILSAFILLGLALYIIRVLFYAYHAQVIKKSN